MFISKKKYQELLESKCSKAWSEGFQVGSSKALHESRKVYINRIKKEIKEVSTMVDIEFLDGLERAIDLIKKDK